MKFTALLIPLWAVIGSASPLERRQLQWLSKVAPSQKAFKIEYLKPTFARDGVKRIRIYWGPYKIKAANSKEKLGNGFSMDPAGTAWNYAIADDFPRDITILRTNTSLAFEDFTVADITRGIYEHHVVQIDLNKKPPSPFACKNGRRMMSIPLSTFMGGSVDGGANLLTTNDGQFNSGYYLAKNSSLLQVGDIVNYANETKTIFSVAEMEYLEGRPLNHMDTSNQIITVGQCDMAVSGVLYGSPNGVKQFTLKGSDVVVKENGYFMTNKGHLHDGGVDVVLKLNGKAVCSSEAIYNKESTAKNESAIRGMTICPGPTRLIKGDLLTVEANFDIGAHPERKHVEGGMAESMALLSGAFAMAST